MQPLLPLPSVLVQQRSHNFKLFKGESHSSVSQDKESGVELELEDNMPLLEWLANNYKSFGATLEIITDRSQEGSQFVRGFGGVGGMLRLVGFETDPRVKSCRG